MFSAVFISEAARGAAAEGGLQSTLLELMIGGLKLRLSANDLLRETWAISQDENYDEQNEDHIFILETENQKGESILILKSVINQVINCLTHTELKVGPEEYLRTNRVYGQEGQVGEILALCLIMDRMISLHQPGQPIEKFGNSLFAFGGLDKQTLHIEYTHSIGRHSGHYRALAPENLNFKVSIFCKPIYPTNLKSYKNLVHRTVLFWIKKRSLNA